MIKAYPDIFNLGNKNLKALLDDEVEAQEKLDGSQFNTKLEVGIKDMELLFRSKNCVIYPDAVPRMFKLAVDYFITNKELLTSNYTYHLEYLEKPHHNILNYGRIPKHNFMLFGISTDDESFFTHDKLAEEADKIGVEVVPLLFKGKINNIDEIKELLNKESFLGNTKVEGIVIKNFHQQLMLGGRLVPILCGKYVSPEFREKNKTNVHFDKKGKFEQFKLIFRNEARWNKAIQHLREQDKLTLEPKDIGPLIKEIQNDILKEETTYIKDNLFRMHIDDILRSSIVGFPEFYKEKLLEEQFK